MQWLLCRTETLCGSDPFDLLPGEAASQMKLPLSRGSVSACTTWNQFMAPRVRTLFPLQTPREQLEDLSSVFWVQSLGDRLWWFVRVRRMIQPTSPLARDRRVGGGLSSIITFLLLARRIRKSQSVQTLSALSFALSCSIGPNLKSRGRSHEIISLSLIKRRSQVPEGLTVVDRRILSSTMMPQHSCIFSHFLF